MESIEIEAYIPRNALIHEWNIPYVLCHVLLVWHKLQCIDSNQVREVKPDVLLGLSACGGLFSKEVLHIEIDNLNLF